MAASFAGMNAQCLEAFGTAGFVLTPGGSGNPPLTFSAIIENGAAIEATEEAIFMLHVMDPALNPKKGDEVEVPAGQFVPAGIYRVSDPGVPDITGARIIKCQVKR